ncbi:MAG: hypothetical protein ABEI52_05765, partial [Halobacteriaceae archaeon]
MDERASFLDAHKRAAAAAVFARRRPFWADEEDEEDDAAQDEMAHAYELETSHARVSNIRSMVWLLQYRDMWGPTHIVRYLRFFRKRFVESPQGLALVPDTLRRDLNDIKRWILPSEYRDVLLNLSMFREFAHRHASHPADASSKGAAKYLVVCLDRFLSEVREEWGEEHEPYTCGVGRDDGLFFGGTDDAPFVFPPDPTPDPTPVPGAPPVPGATPGLGATPEPAPGPGATPGLGATPEPVPGPGA